MLDGNFAGFQEHKESLNVNGSLKSNGWNLEPKFNTYFCDIEIGGSIVRSSMLSQHNHENTSIRQSVIQEETEEEIERHEEASVNQIISKRSQVDTKTQETSRKAGVIERGNI